MAKPSDWKIKARTLRDAGLLDIDLRKQPNQQKRGWITRLFNQYSGANEETREIIKRPDEYFKLHIKSHLKQNAQEAGYSVFGNTMYVKRTKFATRAKMIGDELFIHEKLPSGSADYRVLMPGTKDFLKLSRQLRGKKWPGKMLFTFKIGQNGIFHRVIADINTLYNYVGQMQVGKVFKDSSFEDLLPRISFVIYNKE